MKKISQALFAIPLIWLIFGTAPSARSVTITFVNQSSCTATQWLRVKYDGEWLLGDCGFVLHPVPANSVEIEAWDDVDSYYGVFSDLFLVTSHTMTPFDCTYEGYNLPVSQYGRDFTVFIGCNPTDNTSSLLGFTDGAFGDDNDLLVSFRDPCGRLIGAPRGAPEWHVSEPFVSLWLRDEPLGYQPAVGRELHWTSHTASAALR